MSNLIVNVSPHLLMDVGCDSRAWSRHVRGYTSQGEAIKAVAGQAFHAAIAAYLDPREQVTGSRQRAIDAFHAIYDPAFARVPSDKLPDQAYVPANLHRVLDRWLEMHPHGQLPWKQVLSVEEAFVSREWQVWNTPTTPHDFTSGGYTIVRLIVRPDAVVLGFDDKIRFVDTKTTGWRISDISWRRDLRLSLQLGLYADAVIQKYGAQADFGGWINALELRQLPSDPNRTCSTHKVKYVECGNEHAKAELIECMTTPAAIARHVADARELAARFIQLRTMTDTANLNTMGSAHGMCRFCAAADWCEAGRYVESLDGFMTYSPWPIEEGHRA